MAAMRKHLTRKVNYVERKSNPQNKRIHGDLLS
jgi:hypothetical protein